MDTDARTAADQGPAAAVAMKTVAAFFGGDNKTKAAAAAINGSPKVQGGRTGTPPSPKGRMQNALPQRRLWEIFAKGSNTEEEPLAMQDLPEGQFHDAEDEEDVVMDGGNGSKHGKKKSSSKGRGCGWVRGDVDGWGRKLIVAQSRTQQQTIILNVHKIVHNSHTDNQYAQGARMEPKSNRDTKQ